MNAQVLMDTAIISNISRPRDGSVRGKKDFYHRARCDRAVHRGEYNASIENNINMIRSVQQPMRPAV
jgi:hypothetical protein